MICLSHQGRIIGAAYELIAYMAILIAFIALIIIFVAIKQLKKAPEKTILGIKYKHIKASLWFIIVAFIVAVLYFVETRMSIF